ncbi:MAG: WD40 repeat domain-containing protein [Actinomycetota bacterium]
MSWPARLTLLVTIVALVFPASRSLAGGTAGEREEPGSLWRCLAEARAEPRVGSEWADGCAGHRPISADHRFGSRTEARPFDGGTSGMESTRGEAGPGLTGPICEGPLVGTHGCPVFASVYDYPGGHGDAENDVGGDWGQDHLRAVTTAPAGGLVFATGLSLSGPEGVEASDYDVATVAFDAEDGHLVWAKRFDGPAEAYDDPTSIAVSPDGETVFVSATRDLYRPEPPDIVLLAYDAATGQERWQSVYEIPGGDEAAYDADMAVSSDGERVAIAGLRVTRDNTAMPLLVVFDATTGSHEWSGVHDTPGPQGVATQIAFSPDDRRILVGGTDYLYLPSNYSDYFLVSYEAEDGEGALTWSKDWERAWDGGWGDDYLRGMALSPDGATVVLTGQSRDASDFSSIVNVVQNFMWATVAFDANTGEERWMRLFTGLHRGLNTPQDLTFSPQGDVVYVAGTGSSDDSPHRQKAYLQAYKTINGADAYGYVYSYGGLPQGQGPPGDGTALVTVATSVTASPDGKRVYMTGYTAPGTGGSPLHVGVSPALVYNPPFDTFVIAYDPSDSFSREWTARYNSSPAHADGAFPVDSVVSSDSTRLFIGGWFEYRVSTAFSAENPNGDNYWDYSLLAYDRV